VTPPARTPLPDIPKGHALSPQTFSLNAETITEYLNAADDSNTCYSNLSLAPPLAVAARALSGLLDQIELPFGSLHTGQEFEMHQGVPLDARLTMSGTLAQRSERAGFVISMLDFEVKLAESHETALTGRTTVMAPAG
jgi:hypothetical protein